MWIWLQNHIGTIVVCVLLALMLGAVAYKMIKDKKQGKSSCGGGCANCAMHGQCHSKSESK